MIGVVMAGGKGTRLRPLTLDQPKPLLPVAGRPVVQWGLRSLERAGIKEVVLTTAYRRELLMDRLGDGSDVGVKIEYVEEQKPLGTAGGVKNAEHLLDERFVVMSADVVADVDLGALVRFHEKSGALATLALTEVEDPTQFGIVGLDDKGRIERFKEKPRPEEAFSNLTNTGIYVVEPEVLERVPAGKPFDWSKDVWTNMVGEELYGTTLEGYWCDVGRPEQLIEANLMMAKRVGQDRFGAVEVAEGAGVESSVLMDGVRVGSGAQVAGSLLLPGVTVAAGAHVEDSVLGQGTRVGSHARLLRVVTGTGQQVPQGATWTDKKMPDPAEG
jgi:NDP-sugar pyrophosphorylase family protein